VTTEEAGRMSEHITSIPVMLNQNKYNYSEVARLLNVHRHTVRRLEDDKDCIHHIVVRGRLMIETRRSLDDAVILAKDPNYYDLGGSDAKADTPMQEP